MLVGTATSAERCHWCSSNWIVNVLNNNIFVSTLTFKVNQSQTCQKFIIIFVLNLFLTTILIVWDLSMPCLNFVKVKWSTI